MFCCTLCTKTYISKQALGGHVSKRHAGSSTSYNLKVVVRDRRDLDRKCLKDAKIELESLSSVLSPGVFRSKLTIRKNELMVQRKQKSDA